MVEGATPYLLRGAREAIRKGAPHEAERALETALDHLEEPARTDALLLLAEALHEQGEWLEVLESIKQCSFAATDPRRDISIALGLEPSFRLGLTRPRSHDDIIADVGRLASDVTDPRARIHAIKYVAHVLVSQREERLALLLQEMLNQSKGMDLGIEDLANLSLAKAILFYHHRDLDAAKRELTLTTEKLTGSGVSNLASSNVRLGLANLHSSSGEYTFALRHNLEAFKSSALLGNNRQGARIAANISLCMVRLGNYQAAVEWGRNSQNIYSTFSSDVRPYALYHVGVALAMLGRKEEAEHIISDLGKVAYTSTDTSLSQDAFLFAADIEATLGRHVSAMKCARLAVRQEGGLLYKNSAGIYGRWSTAVLLQDVSATAAQCALDEMLSSVDEYDTIDQAELLCARTWLDSKRGVRTDWESEQRLKELLSKLPLPVGDQLRRTGFLGLYAEPANRTEGAGRL
jgi:tetratricopeptide (TPR) repeat protein